MAYKYNPFSGNLDFYQVGKAITNTVAKNADFTGVAGEMYLVTTGNATITMTFPSATAGDLIIVKIVDNTALGNVVTSPATETLGNYNAAMLYVYNGATWETMIIDFGNLDQYQMIARTDVSNGRPQKVNMVQEWTTAPTTLTDPGFVGQKAANDNFLFFCYLVNTWAKTVRVYPTPATITTNTALGDDATFIKCDDTAGGITLTLPSAIGKDTKPLIIKKIAGANSISVTAQVGETIEGVASVIISTIGDSITIISDGTEWWII